MRTPKAEAIEKGWSKKAARRLLCPAERDS
jgi:hypothetical protein